MAGIFNLGKAQTFRGESIDAFAVEVDTLFNDLDTAVRFLRTESIRPMSGVHHSALAFLERQNHVKSFPRFENVTGTDELTLRLEGVIDTIWEKIKAFFKWIKEKIMELFGMNKEVEEIKPAEAKIVVDQVQKAVKVDAKKVETLMLGYNGGTNIQKKDIQNADWEIVQNKGLPNPQKKLGHSNLKITDDNSNSKDPNFKIELIKEVRQAISKIRSLLRFSDKYNPVNDLEYIKDSIENIMIISKNVVSAIESDDVDVSELFKNITGSDLKKEISSKEKSLDKEGCLFYGNFRKITFVTQKDNRPVKENFSLDASKDDYDPVEMVKNLMEVGVNASILSISHNKSLEAIKSNIDSIESKINSKKADPKLSEKTRLVMGTYMNLMYVAEDINRTLNKCKETVKEVCELAE